MLFTTCENKIRIVKNLHAADTVPKSTIKQSSQVKIYIYVRNRPKLKLFSNLYFRYTSCGVRLTSFDYEI